MTEPLTPQDPGRHARLRSLVDRAGDLPEAEWGSFLARECPDDPDLRAEASRLLLHARAAASEAFLEPLGTQDRGGPQPERTWGGSDHIEASAPSAPTEGLDDDLDFLEPPAAAGNLGRLGRYDVLGVVGRGGMGLVLKAFDGALQRVVAIKVMAPHLAAAGAARRRFLREAQAAAAVVHDNVLAIHSIEQTPGGLPFLVMPLVAGRSLQEVIVRDGPLGVAEILRIGLQVAAGLEAAHASGLVHRDVKPANILLENSVQRVKLTDFGLARAIDDAGVTHSGAILGTPQYMSPEQARGEPLDHRADLYALGGVLYAMCTGRPPFRGCSALSVLRKVCDEDPRPILTINPEIPRWLIDVTSKLMAKKPSDRYQTTSEVVELLERLLAHVHRKGTHAAPSTDLVAPTRPPRRAFATPRTWAALAFLGSALLVAAAMALFRPNAPRPQGGETSRSTDPNSSPATTSGAGASASATAASPAWSSGTEPPLGAGLLTRPTKLAGVRRWQVETNYPRCRILNAALGLGHGRIALTQYIQDRLAIYDPRTLLLERIITLREGRCPDRLAWSPTGDRIAVGGGGYHSRAAIVSPDGSREVLLRGHEAFVTALAWASDGDRLATGARDKSVRLWKRDGTPGPVLQGHDDEVVGLSWSPNGDRLASIDASGSCRLWTPDGRLVDVVAVEPPRRIIELLGSHSDPQRHLDPPLAWSPDSLRLAVAGRDRSVLIVDPDGRPQSTLKGHEGAVNAIAWSPEGDLLASAGRDGAVRIWTSDGRPGPVMRGHEVQATALSWTPDGRRLASAGFDEVVRVWGRDGSSAFTFRTGTRLDAGVPTLDWDPTNNELLIVDGDSVSRLDPAGALVQKVKQSASAGWRGAIAWHPDGRSLLTFCPGVWLLTWDSDGELLSSKPPEPRGARVFAIRPDGKRVALGTDGGDIWVQGSDGGPGQRLAGHSQLVHAVCWSPDGLRLASASADSTVRIWTADGFAGPVLRGHRGAVRGVAWSPDGQRLASVGDDHSVHVWNAAGGDPVLTLAGHEGISLEAAWRPDGQRLATADIVGKIRFWAADGLPGPTLLGHRGEVIDLKWSPGGDRLASESIDRDIRIWFADGVGGPVLTGPGSMCGGMAWCPDGSLLASWSNDATLLLWDAKAYNLERIAVLTPSGEGITLDAGGRVLHGKPETIRRELRYFVEGDDGRYMALSFDEFASRYPGASVTSGGSVSTPPGSEGRKGEGLGLVDLVDVPPGRFLMGSNAFEDEQPVREVKVTRPFQLGKCEITQDQYQVVMGRNPSRFLGDGLRPVDHVSWFDAVGFCNSLSVREGWKPYYTIQGAGPDRVVSIDDPGGKGYRLPTEAEWEYACRGGVNGVGKYSFGDDANQLGEYAWFQGNSNGSTHAVGERGPNAFGLHDMHGNVWEWCWDWYGANYEMRADVDPHGPSKGAERVFRGGSFRDSNGMTSADRLMGLPTYRGENLGFRIARNL